MTTKATLRQSLYSLITSKFPNPSGYFSLSNYEDLLLRLSSDKLHVLYKLFYRCFTNGFLLNFDTVYMLTFDYAFTLNFSEFLSYFAKDMQTYNCTLSAPDMLSLIDYLNLTYDESVSLISGIDTPETANT